MSSMEAEKTEKDPSTVVAIDGVDAERTLSPHVSSNQSLIPSTTSPTASSLDIDQFAPDEEPTTKKERWGWYLFAFASEPYSALFLAVFASLIIQSCAAYSGVTVDDHNVPCDPSAAGYNCVVKLGNSYIGTSSLYFYSVTISVILQIFVFLGVGAIADHGNRRKSYMILWSVVSIIMGLGFLVVYKPSLYWLAALLYILGNLSFGVSYVFLYAWVPILTRYSPILISARQTLTPLNIHEYHQLSDKESNRLSGNGFASGYVGAVIVLVISLVVVLLFGDGTKHGVTQTYGLQIMVAFASVWWALGMVPTVLWMRDRPGPPVPKGENVVTYSYMKFYQTFQKARKLPNLFLFLIGWFIYADAFSTIISVAVLYFQSELGASQSQLLIAATITPLFGAISSIFWPWIRNRFNVPTQRLLLVQVAMYLLLCVYGLVGFATRRGTWGMQSAVEIFPLAAYHGFILGATQSMCRVIYSEMVPPGLEAEFFSLYEITDKGSAWLGPLVVGAITDSTHNGRYSLYFLACMFLVTVPIFYFVDVKKGKEDAKVFLKEWQSVPHEEVVVS
ncbi:Autophagy protein 22 [Rhizophlyctis rosea]|nr:Autophagy protein 22 [Rhizophlyctis rosea]